MTDASAFPCITNVAPTADESGYVLATTYLQAGPEGVTVWAWSAATQRVYPAVQGADLRGQHPAWDVLDAEGGVIAGVQHTPGDCACSHPMKGWRPPGASRVSAGSVPAGGAGWGGPATSGFPTDV